MTLNKKVSPKKVPLSYLKNFRMHVERLREQHNLGKLHAIGKTKERLSKAIKEAKNDQADLE